MNSIANLTPQHLRNAAELQEQILALQSELADLLRFGSTELVATPKLRRRRMSAQGLANIRAGARKRWAWLKGRKITSAKRKGKMSAASRARIAAALRARWKAAKMAGKNAL
jgi:hypothetical protein